MEFLAGSDGPIIPDPETAATEEHKLRTEAAMTLFRGNADRVQHFMRRAKELGRSGNDTVVTLIDVRDPLGSSLADRMMPRGYDWQQHQREPHEIPIMCGLAAKPALPQFLHDRGCHDVAEQLRDSDELQVVVLHAGVAVVLEVNFDVENPGAAPGPL